MAESKSVNTPPPERRWLQITAQSRIGPPSADSGHVEVVVRFRRGLVLDVFGPDLIGHVAAARNPVACSLCELRPFMYCTARDTDRLGGIDTSMCTWSRLIDPACTT